MTGFLINTNLVSLFTTGVFNRTLLAQQPVLRSLSTGFVINSGRDGPAALISSESLIATLRVLEAQSNALMRSDSVIAVADVALGEVSNLLIETESLAVAAANTGAISDEEREALQMELDSIVQSVDRILSTSSFAGTPLFDGKLELSLGGHDSLTIPSISAAELGATEIDGQTFTLADVISGQGLDLASGDPSAAQSVIDAARSQIDLTRGEIGAAARFTIEPRLLGLAVAFENTAAANSFIRDTDFARATAELSRLVVLAQTGFMVTSIANSTPQSVLRLLTSVSFGTSFFF